MGGKRHLVQCVMGVTEGNHGLDSAAAFPLSWRDACDPLRRCRIYGSFCDSLSTLNWSPCGEGRGRNAEALAGQTQEQADGSVAGDSRVRSLESGMRERRGGLGRGECAWIAREMMSDGSRVIVAGGGAGIWAAGREPPFKWNRFFLDQSPINYYYYKFRD
jgi:hypothetical protein